MNFLLRHEPVLTFDVDIWIEDTRENLDRCEKMLLDVHAEWGPTESDWQSVRHLSPGWLARQSVYSVLTDGGPLDVFRSVLGLEDWGLCYARSEKRLTVGGETYWSLSDTDMLSCQLALDEGSRKLDRVRYLSVLLKKSS
ncbi:MAG: hypothetical protein U1E27_06690 [Kiritimatiellia bacterium]|nr:hypothetical protein [Kiritimatiellia bacterium]